MASLPPILLVDNEPDDLYILRRLIVKAGVKNKVVAMEDPLAAIEYLDLEARNGRPLYIPCAILTDLNMPGKNGCEVTRWIRAHPQLREIRVVMVTDSDNPADEQRAVDAGVTCFVRKFPTSQQLETFLGALPCVPEPKEA